MTFGLVGSPATLDPYSPLASDLTYELAAPVYPSLFRFDPHGTPHPYLAAAIERIPGGVRVNLRHARWSDGRPVSARDVVRTWRRARQPSGLARVTSARATGRRIVALRGRVRDWPQALATVAYILPRGRAARVSSGPLRVRSYTRGLHIVFARNPRWWGHTELRSVTVEFEQSLQTLLLLLQGGHLDAAAPPSSVNLDARLDAVGLRHSDALGWESVKLLFPGTSLTRDQRLALGATIDRARLAGGFLRDEGRPATTLYPGPGPSGARGPWSHDRVGGGPIRTRVTLSAPTGDELLELVQRALQIEMRPAASDVELVGIDPQTFYGRWRKRNPTQIALLRRAGAPGLGGDVAAYRAGSAVPLFQVATVVAWRDGLAGLRADPTFDGPLWNVQRWSSSKQSP